MEPLIKYRLPDNDDKLWMIDYIQSMGLNAYTEYENKVFHALDILRPGKHYNIEKDVPPDKQDLFVKLCCLYIQKHPEVVFSNDYTKIEKYNEQWKLVPRRQAIHKR